MDKCDSVIRRKYLTLKTQHEVDLKSMDNLVKRNEELIETIDELKRKLKVSESMLEQKRIVIKVQAAIARNLMEKL